MTGLKTKCYSLFAVLGLMGAAGHADAGYVIRTAVVGPEGRLVLDVPNGSTANNVLIQLFPRHTGTNQVWEFEYYGSGYYRIRNRNSGKYLDIAFGSKNDGVPLQQYQLNTPATDNQLWSLQPVGSAYRIVNKASGKVLDVPNSSGLRNTIVQQFRNKGNSDANQLWYLEWVN